MIGGLEPYAAYRDSGPSWLGQVPAHWRVQRIKTVMREVDRRSVNGTERLLSLRMQAGLVDHHALGGKHIPSSVLIGYKHVLPGEIVMNRMRASAGLFAVATSEGLVSGTNAEWEKLSILLNLLVSKLPAPKEEDLANGILEAIDMDSYRVEKKARMKIALADTDAEIAPVPTEGGGRKPEPELDGLSNILKSQVSGGGRLSSPALSRPCP